MSRTDVQSALAPESHSARMLAALKELLQARRMRYADVAAMMDVSEKSIKRYMSGRGVTLPVLETLCAAVGVSLAELSELAEAGDRKERPWTTDAQEAVLATEPKLAFGLALLANGWTASRIVADGLANESDLNAVLVRLDRLKLITLYPNNRVIVRARLRTIEAASEPLRRVILKAGTRILQSLDLEAEGTQWRMNYARLGPASFERVVQRLKAFLREVEELGRQDMDLEGEQVKWHAVCGIVTEHEILGLQRLRDSANEGT